MALLQMIHMLKFQRLVLLSFSLSNWKKKISPQSGLKQPFKIISNIHQCQLVEGLATKCQVAGGSQSSPQGGHPHVLSNFLPFTTTDMA